MREAFVVGVGMVPVRRRGAETVRELGREAVRAAIEDAGPVAPTAVFVGNMLAGSLCHQRQLGALIADAVGLRGIEASVAEAACASGAAAMRSAVLAVASGAHDVVVAAGVERMTHIAGEEVTKGLATASDWDSEGGKGETFLSLNARLTREYLARHGLSDDALAPFALNAHDNASRSPHALYRAPITLEDYRASRVVAESIRLYDVSPICDGAAAVVVCSREALATLQGAPRVAVRASTVATDSVGLDGRRDRLVLDAAVASTRRAYELARIGPEDVDFFELHDAYGVMAALALEAAGFAEPGRGHVLAAEGAIRPRGAIPVATMGGLKARGHPVGATGIYQIAEAYLQLVGRAGACQLEAPRIALTQSFGGTAATVYTHVLARAD